MSAIDRLYTDWLGVWEELSAPPSSIAPNTNPAAASAGNKCQRCERVFVNKTSLRLHNYYSHQAK